MLISFIDFTAVSSVAVTPPLISGSIIADFTITSSYFQFDSTAAFTAAKSKFRC